MAADPASDKPAALQNSSAATGTEKEVAPAATGAEKEDAPAAAAAREANQDGVSTDKTEDIKAEEEAQDDEDAKYPKGMPLILIILSLCLAVFLVALDQTIIAPALGAITADFQSVKDIVSDPLGWPLVDKGLANNCARDGVS
jgi:hypothetical protein